MQSDIQSGEMPFHLLRCDITGFKIFQKWESRQEKIIFLDVYYDFGKRNEKKLLKNPEAAGHTEDEAKSHRGGRFLPAAIWKALKYSEIKLKRKGKMICSIWTHLYKNMNKT